MTRWHAFACSLDSIHNHLPLVWYKIAGIIIFFSYAPKRAIFYRLVHYRRKKKEVSWRKKKEVSWAVVNFLFLLMHLCIFEQLSNNMIFLKPLLQTLGTIQKQMIIFISYHRSFRKISSFCCSLLCSLFWSISICKHLSLCTDQLYHKWAIKKVFSPYNSCKPVVP